MDANAFIREGAICQCRGEMQETLVLHEQVGISSKVAPVGTQHALKSSHHKQSDKAADFDCRILPRYRQPLSLIGW